MIHKKVLNIKNHQRKADEDHDEVPPHTCYSGYYYNVTMAIIKITRAIKCEDVEKANTYYH